MFTGIHGSTYQNVWHSRHYGVKLLLNLVDEINSGCLENICKRMWTAIMNMALENVVGTDCFACEF